MARRRKTEDIVDGFTTIKAAQRAVSRGVRPPPAPAPIPPEPAAPKPPAPAVDPSRIGRTAQPTRHSIVCYECGYAFTLTGQLKSTYCPKCRCILDATERTIDKEWSDSLKTIGTVRIAETGVVTGGRLAANHIVLAGEIRGGRVEGFGRLEVLPGGRFNPDAGNVGALVIGPGARVDFPGEILLKDVEIRGVLRGRLTANGTVTIRAGGLFEGTLSTRHWVVDDGGGVRARVSVATELPAMDPADAPVPPRIEPARAKPMTGREKRRSAA